MSATSSLRAPDRASGPRRSRLAAVLIRVIGLYQALRAGRASPCRYWPTCSEYATEAVERHGPGRGSLLAVRRVLRCHPWGGHGVDPVPPVSAGPEGRRLP